MSSPTRIPMHVTEITINKYYKALNTAIQIDKLVQATQKGIKIPWIPWMNNNKIAGNLGIYNLLEKMTPHSILSSKFNNH